MLSGTLHPSYEKIPLQRLVMHGSQRNFLVVALIGLSFTLPRLVAALAGQAGCDRKGEIGNGSSDVSTKSSRRNFRGAFLTGQFSVVGRGARLTSLRAEKYTISKVSKLPNGLWLFESRMQYGKNDLTIPLPLKVIWVATQPIITLIDMTIPGLGTSHSVMIYGDRYARHMAARQGRRSSLGDHRKSQRV